MTTPRNIIRAWDHAGIFCTLTHDETGQPVALGDKLATSKGDIHTITGGTAPHKPGSTGRIYTEGAEYFPGVFGCTWRAANVKTDRLTQAARAMEKQGGSFAAAIALAYFHADQDNAARLLGAFGHLFDRYAPARNRDPIITPYTIGQHFGTWIAYDDEEGLTAQELADIKELNEQADISAPEGYHFALGHHRRPRRIRPL